MQDDIGKRVKELRTGNRMTLKDLSEKTGLSTGFLSQLERGMTSIATDSLSAIAKVFAVEVGSFFSSHKDVDQPTMRSYEKEIFKVENRFIHYHLTHDLENKHLLPRLVELLPINSDEPIRQYPHCGEEFIYVLEGTLTLFIHEERKELFPGDTAHYDSTIPHNWANYTNKMVRILVVSTPNPFMGEK